MENQSLTSTTFLDDTTEPRFRHPPGDVFPETAAPERQRRRHAAVAIWTSLGLGLLIVGIAAVTANRLRRDRETAAASIADPPIRSVRVIRPSVLADADLTLPANIDAFQSTSLYSRVNGYVRQWHAEIGDRVKHGQVLAEIDTPDLDQELEQARANVSQGLADLDTAKAALIEAEFSLKQAIADVARAKANLEYSRGVHARNTVLSKQHVIPQQDFDDSRRDVDAKQADIDSADAQHRTRESNLATRAATIKSREATVNSLKASVRRLEQMQGFQKIVAPFDGIVTRRRAEVGMLVTAGNPQTSQELFAVAEADRLRVKINVPQALAPSLRVGASAQVLVPEYPNRAFTAKIARTAGAIDPVARTLAVELELSNTDYVLLPGAFGQVSLSTRRAEPTPVVPVNALVSRPEGPQVAVVDPQGVARLRKVELGRDYGRTVEVLRGLRGDESLVVNPPDDLADNERVAVADSP